jgi:hypothetical protein
MEYTNLGVVKMNFLCFKFFLFILGALSSCLGDLIYLLFFDDKKEV